MLSVIGLLDHNVVVNVCAVECFLGLVYLIIM